METRSTIGRYAAPRKGRRRLAAALVALGLLLAGFALFVGHLQSGPALVNVSSGSAGRNASIVFASGDVGLGRWSMGGQVARQLGEAGYTVLGLDSLAAFSQRRTPQEATDLVARAIRMAPGRGPDGKIVLIGQSFGADVLVIALPRLPPALMRRIDRVILIAPSTAAYLKVSPAEMLGLSPPDVDLVPLARGLRLPVTCIYGLAERDSLCTALGGANVRRIGLSGGHFLGRDADRLFGVVRSSLGGGA